MGHLHLRLSSQFKLLLSQYSQDILFELVLSERSHFRTTLGFQNTSAESPAGKAARARPCAQLPGSVAGS